MLKHTPHSTGTLQPTWPVAVTTAFPVHTDGAWREANVYHVACLYRLPVGAPASSQQPLLNLDLFTASIDGVADMIRKLIVLAGCLFLFGQSVGTALATPLTEQQVERYLNSMPQAQALSAKHDDGKRKKIDRTRPLASGLDLMKKTGPAYEDLSNLAKTHGFSSAEEWADVGDRVMNGYVVLSSNLTLAEVEKGYQQGITNVNKDPKLSEASKRAVLAGMEKGHARNVALRKNAEQDLPALAPHRTALDEKYGK